MFSQYDPPKSTDRRIVDSRLNWILRWIGALSFGYLAVITILSDFISQSSKYVSVPLTFFLAFGLLRLGRKFCLGVAIFIAVIIFVHAYFNLTEPDSTWLAFARSGVPHLTILVCAFALYFRLPRRIQEAEHVVGGNGG